MTIKELVLGEGNVVRLHYVEDGEIHYELVNRQNAVLLSFKIPHEDQLGATFTLYDSPKFFMRWIRKELERQEAEKKMIETAREEWKRENQ